MSVIRSTGINYELPSSTKARFDGFVAGPEKGGDLNKGKDSVISTLHLELDVHANYREDPIRMISPLSACGSGCRSVILPVSDLPPLADEDPEIPLTEDRSPVEILRFAKDGRTPYQPGGSQAILVGLKNWAGRIGSALTGVPAKPVGFEWLVTMEDGHSLQGWVSTSVHGKERKSTARMRMGGKMIITYRTDDDPVPHRLMSREEPIFEGIVMSWPPAGTQMRLVNGPIEYYRAQDIFDLGASPALTVLSNTITFSDKPVTLLNVRPQILEAIVVTPKGEPWTSGPVGGVRLTWNDTRALVSSDEPRVAFYHIYRNFDKDSVNGWVLVGILPATTLQYIDRGYRGDRACDYIVLHAALYPFDYHYESLVGTPVRVNTTQDIDDEKKAPGH